ncbi:SagB-type dehydrogenase family enzyme [Marinilabilia salmonicolor]|jgi:SagB-type dehydrogenase family enzyme|uniref:SagB/ThcOx family dehydrogenase n=1 Tax=Marinilabilia salmonicolor TaxID=989 RepID=UPI000D06E343|nr:SagB/ThcOx family dehydrogenase [Marinilabilia salmonicolor]PRZ00617.1 SagB-type dehydrogenase family enzyme [Marinilabilia salmonicolor]
MKNQLLLIFLAFFSIPAMLNGQNINLPEPDKTGGLPLMEALSERSSSREFSSEDLTKQQLSNLCWAAWGYNRKELKKRTAPSSMNKQEMELYVVLKDGAYLYNAASHQLDLIKEGDLRSYCGSQDFVSTAPVNFVYVANMKKTGVHNPGEITPQHIATSHANTGFIAQNTYLACASEGLVCVVRAWIDKEAFAEALGLSPLHKVILAHTIGHAK